MPFLMGFFNLVLKEAAVSKIPLFEKEGDIEKIEINGDSQFDKDSWFPESAEVVIHYYALQKQQ